MAALAMTGVETHRYAASPTNLFDFPLEFMAVHGSVSHKYVRVTRLNGPIGDPFLC
jgi:hypothetical protein